MTHLLNYDIIIFNKRCALALNGRLYASRLKTAISKVSIGAKQTDGILRGCLLKTLGLRKKYFHTDYFTNQINLIERDAIVPTP